VACVRVQARDPDALANVRIAYGPYARRCGVCARTPRRARPRAEPNCTSPRVSGARSVSLCRLYLRSRSRESGARDTASGLGYTRFFFLRTTVLQHELFFSQYDVFVLCTHFVPDRSRGCGVSAVACPQIHLCESTPRLRSMAA
jgi:hypothetical protein